MKFPEPIWAVMLAVLGVVLASLCLFHSTPENVVLAILAIASNLVSGALGAFAGHAGSTTSVNAPNSTVTSSTGSVDTFQPK